MIAVLGRIAVAAALLFGASGAVAGWAAGGGLTQARAWTWRFAWAFAAAMALSVGLLEAALLGHDFSIGYVAQVGSRGAPTWVSAVSLWSALEGSVLFWGFILAVYVLLFAWSRRRDGSRESATALGVLLAAGAGFAFLAAIPASPFGDVLPPPLDGPGPNPLLQNHPLMAIHPPLLYLGYVGMSVPFALATAALRAGRLDAARIAPLRAWLLSAWILLTLGIALGARWAYDVLGWGGYWSWDPVENASLLPWLVATAALHALRLSERRGTGKAWSLALVQASFALTWLGTFLTRSGVVSSVHSFAPSAIGPSLLALLAIALFSSVLLLALRAGALEGPTERTTSGRALSLVANNLVLALLTMAVLLGTLWPVAARAYEGTKVSVGEGFFDGVASPLALALLFLMAVGPALPWGATDLRQALRSLAPRAISGAVLALAGLALGARGFWLLSTLALGGFALAVALEAIFKPFASSIARGDGSAVARLFAGGRRRIGAHLAHAGVALLLVAVAASSEGRRATEVTLKPGEPTPILGYVITFRGAERLKEPQREVFVSLFDIARDGRPVGVLGPRLSHYLATDETLGTPAVRSTPFGDLYLTVIRMDPARREVGLRVQVAPMISWIWIAAALVALGGFLAIPWPRRRREAGAAPAKAPASLGLEVRA